MNALPSLKTLSDVSIGYLSRSGTAMESPGSSLLCYSIQANIQFQDSPIYQIWEEHLIPTSNRPGWNLKAKAGTFEEALAKTEPGDCIVGP